MNIIHDLIFPETVGTVLGAKETTMNNIVPVLGKLTNYRVIDRKQIDDNWICDKCYEVTIVTCNKNVP